MKRAKMMLFIGFLCFSQVVFGQVINDLELSEFGGYPDGSDVTPAWNAAIQAARTGPAKTIHLDAGQYYFYTRPGPIDSAIRILGDGKSSTVLRRAFSGGDFIVVRGLGSSIQDLTIWAEEGTTGGVGLHIISDEQAPGGHNDFRNIWITGMGTYALPLFLDGLKRTSSPNGLRGTRLDNVTVFNGTWYTAELWNCINCQWYGGAIHQGFGTVHKLVIGGPLSTNNRIDLLYEKNNAIIWSNSLR